MSAKKRAYFCALIMVFCFYAGRTQNVTSPYSILGIGDVDTKNAGRYFISGSAALARRESWAYNASNPAALTALPLKTMHFDLMMRGKNSTYTFPGKDTTSFPNKDFIIRRITLAFKVNNKTGFAFGLQPYSSVNYQLVQEKVTLDDNTSYDKKVEGSGGINQAYFSLGHKLGKKLSVGLTASYLFGSLQRETNYSGSFINITKRELDYYRGALVQGGLQYYSLPGKQWQHSIGIVGSISTDLKGELTTDYLEDQVSLSQNIKTGRHFDLPVTAGIGYAATNRSGLTVSLEGNYYDWNYQKVSYNSSYTYPAARASAGLEYSIKDKKIRDWERGFIGFGFSAENSYIRIKDRKLWDYSVSFGGGVSVFKQIALYTGLEIGKKGKTELGQIRENYTQFVVGITLKDIWLGTKKYGRFGD